MVLLDPTTILVTFLGILTIAFLKGALGGGFAIVGIPLLAIVMDPLTAGAILAPLLILMDAVALRYWTVSTWSAADLKALLPGLVLGICVGVLLLTTLDPRSISILLAIVTLSFTAHWFLVDGAVVVRERSYIVALAAGTASGITTMIAHSGGPPLAMYLLRIGLPKPIYAGTTSLFFTVGNLIKLGPWMWIGGVKHDHWWLILIVSSAVPVGVWLGWKLHEHLDQRQLYLLCYSLLTIVAVRLFWEGLLGPL